MDIWFQTAVFQTRFSAMNSATNVSKLNIKMVSKSVTDQSTGVTREQEKVTGAGEKRTLDLLPRFSAHFFLNLAKVII